MKKIFLIILVTFFIIKINAQTTRLVTNTADAGVGSLRAAVAAAAPGDIIRISPASFTGGGITIITLTSGEIAFSTSNLVFKGFYNANGDTVKISGNNTSRIFDIINATYDVLDSMVVINGNSNDNGGAIIMTGTNMDSLLIANSVINSSTSNGTYGGGGIYADSNVTNLKITNCTIVNNSAATGSGGAVSAFNNLRVANSTIANNSAYYIGGGLLAGSNLTVVASTISGNTALNAPGGGIVSGNSTTVINSTIVGNTTGLSGYAGGIYSSPIIVSSSIVANNTGGDIFDFNTNQSNITSGGYNIFTDVPSGAISTDQVGIAGTCVQLGPLQNNGGSTFTMLPLMGSVAINQGNPADNSIAQNGIAPHGIRDVGAAESMLNSNLYYDTVSASVCSGYPFGNNIYFTSGDYMDTSYSSGGCDSIVSLHLILLPVSINYDTVTLASNCNGYTFGNNTYFTSGNYIDTLYSLGGCDSSIINLHLTIPPLVINYDTATAPACNGYTIGNNTYFTSGDYMDTLYSSISGCDSIVDLHLIISTLSAGVVTTLADNGAGSLRAIVASACSGDTVRFAPSLISNGSATILLTSGAIAFDSKNLIFKGLYNANGDTLYISGNNASQVFNITNTGYDVLDSMVLINGSTNNSGGAVSITGNDDSLLISNSIVRNNISYDYNYGGGGIYADNIITLINSSICNNAAPNGSNTTISGGGGVYGARNVTAINCLFNGNTDGGGRGGSIFSFDNTTVINSIISNNISALGAGVYSATNVTVINSTIDSNIATTIGGVFAGNDATVTNSTIVGNTTSTDGTGGGIYAFYGVTVTNSTVTGNINTDPNSAGGIFAYYFIKVTSSIVANNTGGDIYNFNASDSIARSSFVTSGGNNIFTDLTLGVVCSDQIGITAGQLKLGPLQNNGGTTLTMLPGAGSVAIDRGNPADNSIAQNDIAPYGIRDVGAAESKFSLVSATSENTSTTCGTDTLHLTSSTNAIWSSTAATLYSSTTGILYNNSEANSVYVKADDNAYVLATFSNNTCPLGTDSILVTVTNNNGSLATSTTVDSSVLIGPTQINDANCQVMALVTPSGNNPVSGTVSVTDSIGASIATFHGSPYLSRVYDITPTQNAANATATITLYYTDAEMQAYNSYLSANGLTTTIPDAPTITMPADTAAAKATFRIIQYHGLYASPYNDANGVVVPITSMFYNSAISSWEVTFNVTGFSGFYAYTSKVAQPLPLTWQYITAIENGSNNEITWSVYNTGTGGMFEVQASTNGQSFSTIASTPYNNMQVVYSAEDVNPPAQAYYRIKYTDNDGAVSYSVIKMINRQQSNTFAITNIYPVPASNNLTVETYSPIATTITYSIVDATGQVVKTEQHGAIQSATQLLNITSLSEGVYLIKVNDALGDIETRVFTKL